MKKIDAFQLKLIAIVAMLINHIGHTFEHEWNPPAWEFFYLAIGLLTFPIMAYLLVEGFFHTKNRWRYAGRLGIFALLSFIPFNALTQGALPFFPTNNIMFTLMAGVLMLLACEQVKHPALQGLILFITLLITIISDWMLFGPALIFAFYKNHGKPGTIKWILTILCGVMLLLQLPLVLMGDPIKWLYSLGILLVIPLLTSYTGQRGYSPNWVKWGFYAFYPLHLLILWGIRFAIFGY